MGEISERHVQLEPRTQPDILMAEDRSTSLELRLVKKTKNTAALYKAFDRNVEDYCTLMLP